MVKIIIIVFRNSIFEYFKSDIFRTSILLYIIFQHFMQFLEQPISIFKTTTLLSNNNTKSGTYKIIF